MSRVAVLRFTSIIRMITVEKHIDSDSATDLSPTDASGADTGWVKAD